MPVIKRAFERNMPSGDLVIAHCELRIADEGESLVDGLSPGFSVTGEVYNRYPNASGAARKRRGLEADLGGCIHDEILRAFPHLRPLVALHLSDPSGLPMHAEANGWYWYAPSQGNYEECYHGMNGSIYPHQLDEYGLPNTEEGKQRYCYRVVCELLRTEIPPNLSRDEFYEFVEAQRERWAQEAAAGLALLLESR